MSRDPDHTAAETDPARPRDYRLDDRLAVSPQIGHSYKTRGGLTCLCMGTERGTFATKGHAYMRGEGAGCRFVVTLDGHGLVSRSYDLIEDISLPIDWTVEDASTLAAWRKRAQEAERRNEKLRSAVSQHWHADGHGEPAGEHEKPPLAWDLIELIAVAVPVPELAQLRSQCWTADGRFHLKFPNHKSDCISEYHEPPAVDPLTGAARCDGVPMIEPGPRYKVGDRVCLTSTGECFEIFGAHFPDKGDEYCLQKPGGPIGWRKAEHLRHATPAEIDAAFAAGIAAALKAAKYETSEEDENEEGEE